MDTKAQQIAVSSALGAVADLNWRLAVLSDCCTQNGDLRGADLAAETVELLERISDRLSAVRDQTSQSK